MRVEDGARRCKQVHSRRCVVGVQRVGSMLPKCRRASRVMYVRHPAPERGGDLPKVTWQITVAISVAVLAFPGASAHSRWSLWPYMEVKAWNPKQKARQASPCH